MNFIPRKFGRYVYATLYPKGEARVFVWEHDRWDVLIFRHGFGFSRDSYGTLQAKIQSFFVNSLNGVDALKYDWMDGEELHPAAVDGFKQFWEWVDDYELYP